MKGRSSPGGTQTQMGCVQFRTEVEGKFGSIASSIAIAAAGVTTHTAPPLPA